MQGFETGALRGNRQNTLAGLLDAGASRLKRLAAKDILDQHAKFREATAILRGEQEGRAEGSNVNYSQYSPGHIVRCLGQEAE